ncbi:uncharacterized protein LOC134824688 [Bolinopsis microptera]|uniref:uncharacterized protein LOC134824688 n=1 Tax=Bolinopsis microptera TaxID=2820187 RepID=UPI0030799016
MKVLVILIGVFSAVSAAVMKCNGVDGVTAEDCEDGVGNCTSPVWSENGGLSAQAYGCGECPANSTATCAQCVATADKGCNVDVTPAPNTNKCKEMTDGSLADVVCPGVGTVTYCTSPVWSGYGGAGYGGLSLSSQAYGCGSCPADSTATCAQCVATAEEGCNTQVALPSAWTEKFQCYNHVYNASKWNKVAAAVTCYQEHTSPMCNSPGESADGTYTVPHNGCGPCDLDYDLTAKTANKCSDCTTTKCNSASTLAFVLAPLLAFIFHML